MASEKSKPIFVSHAAADRAIADKVVDLLNTAMGIAVVENVFCTSLEGLGIPAGKDFKQFIKEQIMSPKIVVLLISRNYLASPFCLAEAGASWALSLQLVPFLVPPVKFDDMKAVLAGIHALRIEDPSDWNEALEIFKKEMAIDPKIARWERKRDEHLMAISHLVREQKFPPVISYDKYLATEAKLADANSEIVALEGDLVRQKELYTKLRETKDQRAVASMEFESLPELDQFRGLVKSAVAEIDKLDDVVVEALYCHFCNKYAYSSGALDGSTTEEISRAIERELLRDMDEQGVAVNEESPKIGRAIGSLDSLRLFVDEVTDGFRETYRDKYDENPSFTSRAFWEKHLKLSVI